MQEHGKETQNQPPVESAIQLHSAESAPSTWRLPCLRSPLIAAIMAQRISQSGVHQTTFVSHQLQALFSEAQLQTTLQQDVSILSLEMRPLSIVDFKIMPSPSN